MAPRSRASVHLLVPARANDGDAGSALRTGTTAGPCLSGCHAVALYRGAVRRISAALTFIQEWTIPASSPSASCRPRLGRKRRQKRTIRSPRRRPSHPTGSRRSSPSTSPGRTHFRRQRARSREYPDPFTTPLPPVAPPAPPAAPPQPAVPSIFNSPNSPFAFAPGAAPAAPAAPEYTTAPDYKSSAPTKPEYTPPSAFTSANSPFSCRCRAHDVHPARSGRRTDDDEGGQEGGAACDRGGEEGREARGGERGEGGEDRG